MSNLPFGITLLVLAVLSVIMPFFCDEERKGISIDINEDGDLMF